MSFLWVTHATLRMSTCWIIFSIPNLGLNASFIKFPPEFSSTQLNQVLYSIPYDFSFQKIVLFFLRSLMTVRCSSHTMAPIWIWSPLWPSKRTSWRAFSRMTQGETDSHSYLSRYSYTLCLLCQNISPPPPDTHTHISFLSFSILIKWEESQAAGYGFLGSTSSWKVWSAVESETDVPSPPRLQLSGCVFTIIDILMFVTSFYSGQTRRNSMITL